MSTPSTKQIIKTSGACLTAIALAICSVTAFATKNAPSKALTVDLPKPPAKAVSKQTTAPATADAQPKETTSPAGAYEGGDNLLTIVRHTQGKPNEYLISYLPSIKKVGQYCSFFASEIIAPGTKSFEASSYIDAQLPLPTVDCKMSIAADGNKAEILEMSKSCQLICGEAQTVPNPGVMKRISVN